MSKSNIDWCILEKMFHGVVMDQLWTKYRWPLLAMICFGLTLAGCASSQPASTGKIGMHFDAVLEFIVEYPLSWEKDRRLPFGSDSGEVRWRKPQQPGTYLQIKSIAQNDTEYDQEVEIVRLILDFAGLEISKTERVALPAGEATLVTGQSRQSRISSYLLTAPGRTYTITFVTPLDGAGVDEDLVEKVTDSFRILSRQGKTSRAAD